MSGREETHSLVVGYVLWIFGFLGAHRFYFGKPISGTVYLLTFGLLGVGWLVDLFLMPGLERQAELRFNEGPFDYTIGWILLTFVGVFGIHRFYAGRVGSGIAMLVLTITVFGIFITAIWSLVDLIILACGSFRDGDGVVMKEWT